MPPERASAATALQHILVSGACVGNRTSCCIPATPISKPMSRNPYPDVASGPFLYAFAHKSSLVRKFYTHLRTKVTVHCPHPSSKRDFRSLIPLIRFEYASSDHRNAGTTLCPRKTHVQVACSKVLNVVTQVSSLRLTSQKKKVPRMSGMKVAHVSWRVVSLRVFGCLTLRRPPPRERVPVHSGFSLLDLF